MTSEMMMRAAGDFWRGRNYGLKEYVIRNGKRILSRWSVPAVAFWEKQREQG